MFDNVTLKIYNLPQSYTLGERLENIYKCDTYKSIDKMGQLVYVDKSKNITPSKLQRLLAEQYRQSFPKEYRYCIQQLNEAGKLSPKSLERIRAADRKNNRNIYISDQSALIRDLDAYIFDLMVSTDNRQNL